MVRERCRFTLSMSVKCQLKLITPKGDNSAFIDVITPSTRWAHERDIRCLSMAEIAAILK